MTMTYFLNAHPIKVYTHVVANSANAHDQVICL